MGDLDKIKDDYETILKLATEYDACLKEHGFFFRVREGYEKSKIRLRRDLEERITSFIALLRKIIESVPESFKKGLIKEYPSGEQFFDFNNKYFNKICELSQKIIKTFEVDILSGLNKSQRISLIIRNLRASVLSFVNIRELIFPKELVSIEKEVEIIFKLREKDMETSAEKLESIIESEKNMEDETKCLYARTALEQVLVSILKKNRIEPQRSFFGNLDLCIKNNLIEKSIKKPIAASYSYISKICHSEIECTESKVRYAINGIYQAIEVLISN